VREVAGARPDIAGGVLVLDALTFERAGVVALTIAQSAAMEYYERIVDQMFTETDRLVDHLEKVGTMPMFTRKLHKFNLMASLLLSAGIPMFAAGDEFGRTQQGNNNAYCQDNPFSWIDWKLVEHNNDLLKFVRELIALRRDNALPGAGCDRRDNSAGSIRLLSADGGEDDQWSPMTSDRSCFGVRYSRGDRELLLLLNPTLHSVHFKLPSGASWRPLIVTAAEQPLAAANSCGDVFCIGDRSLALLVRDAR